MIDLSCDYNCGCTPEIMEELIKANAEQQSTYGFDRYCDSAKEKIKAAVGNPDADIYFIVGGTQTNAIVLADILQPWEGVVCAESGHITGHEAGAIEASGHKVITVRGDSTGKIDLEALQSYLKTFYDDSTCEHMVQPGAVYISQPTEYGGIYSKAELIALRRICDRYSMRLYADGARLAYALSSSYNDVTLEALGKLCDAFYIGGTKCGALFGEAVVFKKKAPHFFTLRKQRGGLLAKGWLLGLQFDVLFTDGLYMKLGRNAAEMGELLAAGLHAAGVTMACDSPTNQQFAVLNEKQLTALDGKIGYSVWEKRGSDTVVRFCTSWRTEKAQVLELIDLLSKVQ